MDNKIFFFTGASGVGKTTLLNYVANNFNIVTKELSGRDFLPKDNSYDKTLTDESQVLISENRFLTCLEDALYYPNSIFLYSRSPVDNLAYSAVLKKAQFFDRMVLRQIELLKKNSVYLYIPIEFEMESADDVVRGQNKEIQLLTDIFIKRFLLKSDLTVINISGTKEERYEKLNLILHDYKV